jgi:D-arabinose 1-dehydrogenase-like Zn-dependent alcohol dehydrogenase
MKAALLVATGQPLVIGDAPRPTIGPDEVLVQTRTCGICRTDVHIQDGTAYVPSLPHIGGHEPAGIVSEVGERVTDFHVGQRVVPHLFLTCGKCHYCCTSQDAQCAHVHGIIGVTTSGGFAEYFKCPARNLLSLPDSVPFDVGGLTSCAVITAVHAFRRAQIGLDDTVAVIGAGGIGQILVQIIRSCGAHAVAVSRSERSLQLAKEAGACLALQFDDERLGERIKQLSDGLGAACAFDCVGTGTSMKVAASCVARGGRIVVIGEEPEFPQIDTIQIAQRELKIIGSRNGSRRDAEDALRWLSLGIIRPVIAKRIPLDDINDGLQMVRDGTAHGRVVVTY